MSAGPFETHLREAIALNRERAPMYAALSGGASRSVSRLLIAAEWLLQPVARWFDGKALPYHRAGVPLLETLFVSMTHVPAFGSVHLLPSEAKGLASRDPAEIRRRVREAFAAESYSGAAAAIADELRYDRHAAAEDALVRHLLESAARLASLAPGHIARSGELGLPSPERLLTRLLLLHLWGLTAASALDRRARALHERGIPILVQDLPPIPVEPPRR